VEKVTHQSSSEIVRYDEPMLKSKFIEMYFLRSEKMSPDKILAKIGAPERMFTEWLQDENFRDELDKIDAEKAWAAREVVFRKLPKILDSMVEVAMDPTRRNGIRAGEILLKIAGVIPERVQAVKAAQGNTTVNIVSQTNKMSIDQLVEKKDELLRVIAQLGPEGETQKTVARSRDRLEPQAVDREVSD
jgi:hypothetical protein